MRKTNLTPIHNKPPCPACGGATLASGAHTKPNGQIRRYRTCQSCKTTRAYSADGQLLPKEKPPARQKKTYTCPCCNSPAKRLCAGSNGTYFQCLGECGKKMVITADGQAKESHPKGQHPRPGKKLRQPVQPKQDAPTTPKPTTTKRAKAEKPAPAPRPAQTSRTGKMSLASRLDDLRERRAMQDFDPLFSPTRSDQSLRINQ